MTTPEDDPKAQLDSYYRALGHFIHQFGMTEGHLAFMLQRYVHSVINAAYSPFFAPTVGVVSPDPLSDLVRALIGTQRSAGLIDIMKAVLRVTGMEKAAVDDMDAVLAQFAEIRVIRDRIAHHGAYPEFANPGGGERRWKSTNYPQGRQPEKINTMFFSLSDLEAASRDLEAIRHRIDAVVVIENPNVRPDVERAGYFEPWRYKPSPRDQRGR